MKLKCEPVWKRKLSEREPKPLACRRKKREGILSGREESGWEAEEPVRVPLEDSLDLHSFSPPEIPEVVEEYLGACQRAGLLEVRLIHGRGRGVQRRIVQSLLQRLSSVDAFRDAPAERGGWGATIVYLEPASHSRYHGDESDEGR